jgi:hypothetical protein
VSTKVFLDDDDDDDDDDDEDDDDDDDDDGDVSDLETMPFLERKNETFYCIDLSSYCTTLSTCYSLQALNLLFFPKEQIAISNRILMPSGV